MSATNPFGTPVAGLALEMAVRNQNLVNSLPGSIANQRRLINQRLQKFGGDISQYEPFMEVGYQPTANALRSQAEGMRDYLVGMPELMAKAMKEGQTSGVTYKSVPNTSAVQDYLQRQLNNLEYEFGPKVSTGPRVSPDTAEARIQPQARPTATSARRLRPIRGAF